MDVGAELASRRLAAHRCYHFSIDHGTAQTRARRFGHELLNQAVGIQALKSFDDGLGGMRRLGQILGAGSGGCTSNLVTSGGPLKLAINPLKSLFLCAKPVGGEIDASLR